jgi:CelD/BcsL family acetyltransferase involved in cellulose biosynthesis
MAVRYTLWACRRDEGAEAMAIEVHEALGGAQREWDSLAKATNAAPFLRPGWIEAWWRAFGAGRLLVLTATEGGEVVGVLPLVRRRNHLGSPTNWHTPIFGGVYAHAEAAGEIAQGIAGLAAPHVRMRFLEEGDPLAGELRANAQLSHLPVLQRTIQSSPYVPIEGTWAEFRARLPQSRRKSIARRERRLAELGEIRLVVEDGSNRLDELLDEGFALEAAGWKGQRRTAILSQRRTRAFYHDVCRWAAGAGYLRLAFLRLDDRAIAFNLCLEDSRAHYALKPGHSPEMARYGPGALLIYWLIERSFSLGLASHELLGASDDFKRSFAGDHVRTLVELQVFSKALRGRATRLLEARGRPLAQRALSARR